MDNIQQRVRLVCMPPFFFLPDLASTCLIKPTVLFKASRAGKKIILGMRTIHEHETKHRLHNQDADTFQIGTVLIRYRAWDLHGHMPSILFNAWASG